MTKPTPHSDAVGTGKGSLLAQVAYLSLAIAGAILPWRANLAFIQESGSAFDLQRFIALSNANPAAQSLSSDLLVGASAVTLWIVLEGRRLRMRSLPWVLLSCVTVAFAFGAPLFLFLRERRLQDLARESAGANGDNG
jgi:hypothetical protein